MSAAREQSVPVWTLSTVHDAQLPDVLSQAESMTSERLEELRSALAAFAGSPIVTLEAHPMPQELDRSTGIPLDAASPLAKHLADLVAKTARGASVSTPATGEVLYRMVVPAKVAAQVGKGLVRPMLAKGTSAGVHSALVGAKGIVAQSTFVPVAGTAAAAGAAGGAAAGTAGAAGAAGGAAAGGAALTVAAPLVLMAVAVGVSAYADHQRQLAIEEVTHLIEKLHSDQLAAERSALNGCRDAIDKATSILLDRGRVGASLGLDSAVHAIDTANARARDRVATWQEALDRLPDTAVSLDTLLRAFPGLKADATEFRAHLELARLAIALKRRVIVLQAVDHSQGDENNPFGHFVGSLRSDSQRLDELEAGIAAVLLRLSALRLRSPERLRQSLMTRKDVDELMTASYRLRELASEALPSGTASDVIIDIARHRDGSVLVLPAVTEGETES